MTLQGKRILVAGAVGAIGQAIVYRCLELGACVTATSRSGGRLAACFPQDNPNLLHCELDLSDYAATAERLDALVVQSGKIDGVVHAAGILKMLPLRATETSDFQEIHQANVLTAFHLAKAIRRPTVTNRPASLVIVSSAAALVGSASQSAYAASKGALISFAKSMAVECARESIRVNVVAPGLLQSAMGDQLRSKVGDAAFEAISKAHLLGLGQPSDVANAVAFLLSDVSRWITGITLPVDGGYTVH